MTEYEALHSLALRLLEDRFGSDQDARLLPGAVPTDLPITLPIPHSSRVVGSWARPGHAFILSETDLDAAAVVSFYREHLLTQGLHELDLRHPVFFPSGIGQEMRDDLDLSDRDVAALEGGDWAQSTFRIGSAGPLVIVRAQQDQQSSGPTTVEIEVGAEPFEWGLDDDASNKQEDIEQIHRLLPVLSPPEGVQTWGGGESWGSEEAHVEAGMLTDLTVQAVADHFNAQIAELGWSEVERGVCGRVAWSQWNRKEAGIGIVELLWFALLLPTEPPEYVLRLHAVKRDPLRPWRRLGDRSLMGWVGFPERPDGESETEQ